MSSAAMQRLSSSVPENDSRYNFVRYSRWTVPIQPRPPCSTSSLHYTSQPFTKLRKATQKQYMTTKTTTTSCNGEKQQVVECDSTNCKQLINHCTINSTYRTQYTNPQERNDFDCFLKTTRFGHSSNGCPVIGIIPNIMFTRQRSLI